MLARSYSENGIWSKQAKLINMLQIGEVYSSFVSRFFCKTRQHPQGNKYLPAKDEEGQLHLSFVSHITGHVYFSGFTELATCVPF
mmetsp:Transcript_13266/g.38993  ORF Transcript_13266/g.38993 Transcript_13266/m.38993 type:complete len:85 (-) Transcript_13266:16-270(-)